MVPLVGWFEYSDAVEKKQKQIPYGNDKQEEQVQKQGEKQIPTGMTNKKGKSNSETRVPFGNDKQERQVQKAKARGVV